jgi:hypothetical protein
VNSPEVASPVVSESRFVAFEGERRVAEGDLSQVALAVKKLTTRDTNASVLIFNDATGEQIDLDLRGSAKDVLARLPTRAGAADAPATDAVAGVAARGPGRPKLGVVAREVTLLPRHWDWLNQQPGGASVALRKLVEEARRDKAGQDRARQTRDVAYRFMSAMAGNRSGFEEAARALFAGDAERFRQHSATWPADIRDHAARLAALS